MSAALAFCGVPKNGLHPRTAAVIRGLDFAAEHCRSGTMTEVLLWAIARAHACACLGGSTGHHSRHRPLLWWTDRKS